MARTDLTGRRVWLTGASLGIGRALAVELVHRGARVALSARGIGPLQALQAELGEAQTLVLPLDVTDPAANRDAARRIEAAWGGLDIAVLNAGTCEYVDVRHFESAVFERQLRTNVLGAVYGIEAVLPLLRAAPHGQLVGVSSAAAYRGLSRSEAYGASKAALKSMLEALRLDLHPEGVAVTVVCPGFVRTPLTARNDFAMPFLLEPEDAARRIADGIAARRAEVHFPRRLTVPLKLLPLLPQWLVQRLLLHMVRSS